MCFLHGEMFATSLVQILEHVIPSVTFVNAMYDTYMLLFHW